MISSFKGMTEEENRELDALRELLCERLKRGGPDQFEVYVVKRQGLSVEIKGGEVDLLDSSQDIGVALRAVKGGRLGFSYCTDLSAASLEEAVRGALEGAEHTAADRYLGLPQGSSGAVLVSPIHDPELFHVPLTEKIERAKLLESSALTHDSRVKRVRKAAYSETEYRVSLANSRGMQASHGGTVVSCSVAALAEENGDSQIGWEFDFGHRYRALDPVKVGRGAAAHALRLLGARTVETRRVPVVLENRVSAEFLSALSPSFLAEMVHKGKSRLAGRVGEVIFAPVVNITDDGLHPDGLGTAPYDGEGVPQRRTSLVSQGRLQGFLFDSYSANREGRLSTGNGCRGDFRFPPRVGITNLIVEKGEAACEQLIEEMGTGFFITDVLGMHTANPITADFSVGCSGFFVEGGKQAHPVKGMAISGNLIDLFKQVMMVGNDLRLFGTVGAPSLLVSEVTVSGK